MPTNNDEQKPTVRISTREVTRRQALSTGAAALATGMLLRGRSALAQAPAGSDLKADAKAENSSRSNDPVPQAPLAPGEPGKDYTPVIVPNGWTLPFKIIDGVKVFHLVAEEVDHEFAPGLRAKCWGYNGSVHGPLIEAVEGDRVRFFVTNNLAAPTTVHWHGILLPSGMDGVGGLNQRAIRNGETYMYEFTLKQNGTFMYHSHHDEMTQMGMGMVGLIVIHPRNPKGPRPDRDFALMLHEWAIEVGAERPDPNEMTDFNVLTINAKAFPGTEPLVAKLNDRVKIRIGNLSAMDHHPIHLHGYYFTLTETDGGRIPEAGQWPETTVLVAVGTTRTVEFVADNPGDWAMHCHMTHHVMNQMGHEFPNMIGVEAEGLDEKVRKLVPGYMTMGQEGMGDMGDMGMKVPANSIPMVGAAGPHDYITMGGMFTILKVRENLANYSDPGWYVAPAGTQSVVAPEDVLRRNGIAADGSSAPKPPAHLKSTPPAAQPTHGIAPDARSSHGGHGGHGGHGASKTTNGAQTKPAATQTQPAAIYTCPMHPEVTSPTPGNCPKCGMKLVLKR
jgi:FtsP/CotA-like multicopper oxidase with cupredoxin domain